MGLFSSLFATQKENEDSAGFFMHNKGPTEPVNFGLACVMSALESTKDNVQKITDDLTKITGSQSSVINRKLLEHELVIRLILTASQSAALFLYLIHQGMAQNILEKVVAGIYQGFKEVSQLLPKSLSSDINGFLVVQFQTYLKSLDDEIKELDGNVDVFSSGKTATLATDRIVKECGIDSALQLSKTGTVEKLMLERHVAVSGIIYILTICPKLKIAYRS